MESTNEILIQFANKYQQYELDLYQCYHYTNAKLQQQLVHQQNKTLKDDKSYFSTYLVPALFNNLKAVGAT